MSNTRKFIVLIFTVMLVISLQFNVPVMTNMNEDFSIEQLVENILFTDAFACGFGECYDKVAAVCRTENPDFIWCAGVLDQTYNCKKD